ncbi:MAG: relaxase domain-containing protein [Actinomycetota bacterium]|nr:relaxase domain-containing protein [Actinomycetota bacterium]
MKIYRGSAGAARAYVEGDRSRADDYYLAEGTGVAELYLASPPASSLGECEGERGVRRGGTLDGDAYESWVAGYDENGASKGRLRADAQGVRFVEVVVNGPKSWSLAAALHPEVAAAYDAAQDRAATQIIGWLAEHATTRVGPRGRQVQVPVQEIEAAVIRHYTSRAGDPHRHLHLQVNARVFAEGRWRGLHTVGVRDSLNAINGIGHAAVVTDPRFRAALAAHGYTVNSQSGEVVELGPYVGAFSARAAQIGRNVDRYEAEWRTANSDQEPGPKLRRSWDDARPDKVVPRDGAELAEWWVEELRELGCQTPRASDRPSVVPVVRVGELDRAGAVETILARLGARRSGWNAADVRGEVEQLIVRTGVVAEAAVRTELAEDLTARAVGACVPLLDQPGMPEHIRALTSREVVEVEADLTSRLIARAGSTPVTIDVVPSVVGTVDGLDVAQQAVVAGLAGSRPLVMVEGAAGAGKTTTLAATRTAVEDQGRRLVVVTPTLKAAGVAAQQIGARAFSAAWLAHQHGYRHDDHRTWTRLRPGDADPLSGHGTSYPGPKPAAVLRPGDVLLVDEAGMLDQDTARALLTIADETGARVALVGDRHQLPAVGRGGVLDLAARLIAPEAHLMLDTVHRFADPEYAELSLAIRTGEDPEQVFDTLVARGQIRLHHSEAERTQALAETAATTGGGPSGEPGGSDGERRGAVGCWWSPTPVRRSPC